MTPEEEALRSEYLRRRYFSSGWEEFVKCGDCGAKMVLRSSAYGRFFGCSTWGETGCKGTLGATQDGRPGGVPANKHTRDLRSRIMKELEQLPFESRGEAKERAFKAAGLDVEALQGVGYLFAEECERILIHFGRIPFWDRLDSLPFDSP